MFDFDAGKLLIIGVVALIVIGPKELPRVLRQVGQAIGRLRRMATEFQGQFMDAMKEADLQDIRDEVTKLGNEAQLNVNFDPARDIQGELTRAVEASPPAANQAEASLVADPLMVEAPAATAGFALPHLADAADIGGDATAASAGIAPAMIEDATQPPTTLATPPPEVTFHDGKKRKIVVKRRRTALDPSGPLATSPGFSRFRNVRPRRHEATES